MNRLHDAVVIIAGGTGYVGEGLVESFLAHGAKVIVPYRSLKKADDLRAKISKDLLKRLDLRHAIITEESSIESLIHAVIRDYGQIDVAVACLGGWYYGYSLHRMPVSDWYSVIQNNLTSHFMFMRPILEHFYQRNDGHFIMLNGGASELAVPESGAISVAAASQKMMTQVLRQEAHGTDINISSVIATQPIETRERKIDNQENWLKASEVGDFMCGIVMGDVVKSDDGFYRISTKR